MGFSRQMDGFNRFLFEGKVRIEGLFGMGVTLPVPVRFPVLCASNRA